MFDDSEAVHMPFCTDGLQDEDFAELKNRAGDRVAKAYVEQVEQEEKRSKVMVRLKSSDWAADSGDEGN